MILTSGTDSWGGCDTVVSGVGESADETGVGTRGSSSEESSVDRGRDGDNRERGVGESLGDNRLEGRLLLARLGGLLVALLGRADLAGVILLEVEEESESEDERERRSKSESCNE